MVQFNDELIIIGENAYSASGCPKCRCGIQSGPEVIDGKVRFIQCGNRPYCGTKFGVASAKPTEVVEFKGRTYVVICHPYPGVKRHYEIYVPYLTWLKQFR